MLCAHVLWHIIHSVSGSQWFLDLCCVTTDRFPNSGPALKIVLYLVLIFPTGFIYSSGHWKGTSA